MFNGGIKMEPNRAEASAKPVRTGTTN